MTAESAQAGRTGEVTQEFDKDTLEFVYGHTRDAPERQYSNAVALDAKMIQVFTAASVTIGLASFAFKEPNAHDSVVILLIAALGTYVVVAGSAIRQLWLLTLRSSLHADTLWPSVWMKSPLEAKHTIVHYISEAYAANKQGLRKKRTTLTIALIAAGAEVLFVGAALIVSLLTAPST